MKETRILMGMPVTLELVDPWATQETLEDVFAYFERIDQKFSTYKENSEISMINAHKLSLEQSSEEMRSIFSMAEKTLFETNGYFDILHDGTYDPSGIVKGWAIQNAAQDLRNRGFGNFYVDAGGDVQAAGQNGQGEYWRVGICNPFSMNEIVKVLSISDGAVATSGIYARGQHIYNPKDHNQLITDIQSLTVVGANIYDADRYATAAFAMGNDGIYFIEELQGFEGFVIGSDKQATFTSGFDRYVLHD